MSKTFKAAIIGIGPSTKGKGGAHSFAYCHGWAYLATEGIELAAGCSRTEKNVSDFIDEFPGCWGFNDYRVMLKSVKPDLVSICAYVADREEMVMAAIEAGAKGVWIEKPFTTSLASAKRMMDAAASRSVRLFVNHQRRYGKPFMWLRDVAADIGEIQGIDILQPFGNIMDFGCHLIDIALFVLGKERWPVVIAGAVDWTGKQDWHGIEVESHLLGSVHFNDGSRLTIETGRMPCSRQPVIRVNGSHGFAELAMEPRDGCKSILRAMKKDVQGIFSPETDEHFHHSDDIALYMKRAAENIYRALDRGDATLIDVDEGYRNMEISMGIYESARQGKVLRYPFDIQ